MTRRDKRAIAGIARDMTRAAVARGLPRRWAEAFRASCYPDAIRILHLRKMAGRFGAYVAWSFDERVLAALLEEAK